ncbi:MAG: hypothetical protein AAF487_06710 [Bacteroidota bacterium]
MNGLFYFLRFKALQKGELVRDGKDENGNKVSDGVYFGFLSRKTIKRHSFLKMATWISSDYSFPIF